LVIREVIRHHEAVPRATTERISRNELPILGLRSIT
jgi:hypothetical protein